MLDERLDRLPDPLPPRLRCDFNAAGWSGEPGDDCYYVLVDPDGLPGGPRPGLPVFLWDDDDPPEILGCLATLETWRTGWRARPTSGFYYGPRPW